MQQQKKINLIIVIIFTFVSLTSVFVISGQVTDAKDIMDENIEFTLLQLGRIRLLIAQRWEFLCPREFLIFRDCQKVRLSGFNPVWRYDRYILNDLKSGAEFDPYQTSKGTGLQFKEKKMVDIGCLTPTFPSSVSPEYMPNPMLYNFYPYHLNGFHLVLRNGKFECKKDVLKNDLEISFESLLLKDESVAYNAGVLTGFFSYVDKYEGHLREKGLIMKKRGDGYFPVHLTTGAMIELPPREAFVSYSIEAINAWARERMKSEQFGGGDYLKKRRFSTGPKMEIDKDILEKEVLDLYGVKIHWNQAEKRYELEE
jgi:hypothetical protein